MILDLLEIGVDLFRNPKSTVVLLALGIGLFVQLSHFGVIDL